MKVLLSKLIDASLLRMLDRDRQRFQLHALLRNLAPFEELQSAHAVALERLFVDWERRWRECRECLPEVIPLCSIYGRRVKAVVLND